MIGDHGKAGCSPACVTRRAVLAGTGAAGLAVLAGCAVYGKPSGGSGNGNGTGGGPASAGPLTSTTDIPVGGGKIFSAEDVVVTQPVAGTFKAFSATCTHLGCIVANVTGGTINCICHGSKFNIADGSVANPPAAAPLPPVKITVTGDQITLG
jgi:Rieske Fe-S protein